MKKHVITIAGSLGAGKSSTGRALAKELGYERFSAGDFQKKAAEALGLALEEYQRMIENDPTYDNRADAALAEAGNKENVIIDARLGFHFVPHSFKVFLFLDPHVAATRMLKDAEVNPMRHKELIGGMRDVEQVVAGITERTMSEAKRYAKYYDIQDHMSPRHFDLIINTCTNDLETVTAMITASYKAWLQEN